MSISTRNLILAFGASAIASLPAHAALSIVFIDLAIAQIAALGVIVAGAGGYASGLVMSTLFDLPSGALIVWCLTAFAVGVYALGPKGTTIEGH